MENLEIVKRYSEEFFGFEPTLFVLPEDVGNLSASIAVSFDIPALEAVFGEFLDGISRHQYVSAIALVMDAWQIVEPLDIKMGGNIFLHYFLSEEMSIENRPRWQGVLMPHHLETSVKRALRRETDCEIQMTSGYWDSSKLGLEQAMKDLVKTTFDANGGIMDLNRADKEPPCGFVIAVINRNNV